MTRLYPTISRKTSTGIRLNIDTLRPSSTLHKAIASLEQNPAYGTARASYLQEKRSNVPPDTRESFARYTPTGVETVSACTHIYLKLSADCGVVYVNGADTVRSVGCHEGIFVYKLTRSSFLGNSVAA